MKFIRISLILSFIFITSFSNPPFLTEENEKWADLELKKMTLNQKIGQLIFVAVNQEKGEEQIFDVLSQIKKYNIGGVVFFKTSIEKYVDNLNLFNSVSKKPLFVAIDGEWGLNMRFDQVDLFPYNITLGAIKDNKLINEMAVEISRQCKLTGIHINLAPSVDINSNAQNPIIGYRSFGEDKQDVALKGIAFMKGLQYNKVLAVAKHFPGHGDTHNDSHLCLPIIEKSKKEIIEFESYPFKMAIDSGIGGIMAAHLSVKSLDTSMLAGSLSKEIITNFLKNELGFKGVVLSDAMNMQGALTKYKPGEVELQALIAGNDIIEYPENVDLAVTTIKNAIRDGVISIDLINERCKKVLMLKKWLNVSKKKLSAKKILDSININAPKINQKLFENAVTVIRNRNIIPLKTKKKNLLINLNSSDTNLFCKYLVDSLKCDKLTIKNDEMLDDSLLDDIYNHYDLLITALYNINIKPKNNYGISSKQINFINKISNYNSSMVVMFTNPYVLNLFDKIKDNDCIIVGYQSCDYAYKATADIIKGKIKSKGKLPVMVNEFFSINIGL